MIKFNTKRFSNEKKNNLINQKAKKIINNQLIDIPLNTSSRINKTQSYQYDSINNTSIDTSNLQHDIQSNRLLAESSKHRLDGMNKLINFNTLQISDIESDIKFLKDLTNNLASQSGKNMDGITLSSENIELNKTDIHQIQETILKLTDEVNQSKNIITNYEKKILEFNETINTEHSSQIDELTTAITKLNTKITQIENITDQLQKKPDQLQKKPDFLKLQKSVSQIAFVVNGVNSVGSGWYYASNTDDLPKGYFITAAHCVMEIINNNYYKASSVLIQNPISNKWINIDTNNIYIDGIADVALIVTNIDFTQYPHLCLKLADKVGEVGSDCYVIGNPGGVDEDSISKGIVRDPHYTEPSGYHITDSIHINAPGIGGNSGGPIINNDSNVIGIYTFGLSYHEAFGGGSNRDTLYKTLNTLTTNKDNKTKLYLGIEWSIPSPFVIQKYYIDKDKFDIKGVYIDYVSVESPFNTILEPGDLLLSGKLTLPPSKLTWSQGKLITPPRLLITPPGKLSSPHEFITFGNVEKYRTPGVLLYYPLNTTIDIEYIKKNTQIVKNKVVILDKDYSNVSSIYDGPLQSGRSITIQKNKKIYNPKTTI